MLYLTFAEQPSGIYEGQVIDVCHFIEKEYNVQLRLLAFISIRNFAENKRIIKDKSPSAIVLPMFPKLKFWYLNRILLFFICISRGERVVICRNVLAANLALSLRKIGILKKVILDGRGAVAAEWNEYSVVTDLKLLKNIYSLEKKAVLEADFRIAVSGALIQHWREAFAYSGDKHVQIPCTLSSNFQSDLIAEAEIQERRKKYAYSTGDILLVYSGSTASWQSFTLLKRFLSEELSSNENLKVLFLSKEDENNLKLKEDFPNQVRIQWLKPEEVQDYLSIADYGILLREESITNKVASPTKFAEYLINGLPVIISPNLGDYSQFVQENNAGIIIRETQKIPPLSAVSYVEKQRLHQLAKFKFLKQAKEIKEKYGQLIENIEE